MPNPGKTEKKSEFIEIFKSLKPLALASGYSDAE